MIKLSRYYLTLLPEVIFFLIWLGVQCYLFVDTFTKFKKNPLFSSTNALLGSGVALAKACAIVINFNSALLIVSMCRIMITWLRSTWLYYLVPFDRYIQLHRLASISIIIFSLIHTIAHYVNFSKIPTKWTKLAFLTGPGATGHILWLIFIIIGSTSFLKKIKEWKFELFWYLHQLSLFFMVGLSFHGSFCFIKRDSKPECPGANSWKWLIGPSFLLIIEFLTKTIRSRKFTFISKVIIHQENVIEIQIKKSSFVFKPGQYLQLNCPEVSLLQWHPFTITSAPEEGFVSIHVRIVGDWTRKLSKSLGTQFNPKTGHVIGYIAPQQLPDVLIDGPYGSVSENYDQFEVAICIGAGIGQTPFSSILKSMWYSITHPNMSMKLKKIIFIQISRQIHSFSWFLDILKALERQNQSDILEINCYLTGKINFSQAFYLHLLNEKLVPDPITGLKSKTNYGRPNFEKLFQNWIERFQEISSIGVFYCGPKKLGSQIKWSCIKNSNSKINFKFHQETF